MKIKNIILQQSTCRMKTGFQLLFLIAVLFLICYFNINNIRNHAVMSYVKQETVDEFIKSVFEASDEQMLYDSNVLLKTLQFIIQDVDEEDPNLLEFVRSLIRKPSNGALNLESKNKKDQSIANLSQYIDTILEHKENGFFLEVGAHDGEHQTNTLYFEVERKWNGILIEPVPSLYRKLLKKNRHAYSLNACLAKNKPFIAKFIVYGAYSGIDNLMKGEIRDDLKKQLKHNRKQSQTAYIPCFPLYTILKAINVKRIDFFSLDVQGGEHYILKNLPYDKIDINTFAVEYSESSKQILIEELSNRDYKLIKTGEMDLFFHKNI